MSGEEDSFTVCWLSAREEEERERERVVSLFEGYRRTRRDTGSERGSDGDERERWRKRKEEMRGRGRQIAVRERKKREMIKT